MESVKKYHIGDHGLTEGEAPGWSTVYLAADFDRVSAENLALQQRLTVQDQRVDELEEQLRVTILSRAPTGIVIEPGSESTWTNEKLKPLPCPFCGSSKVAPLKCQGADWVGCDDCGVICSLYTWNRRYSLNPTAEAVSHDQ